MRRLSLFVCPYPSSDEEEAGFGTDILRADIPASEGGQNHVTVEYGKDVPRRCTEKLAREPSTSGAFLIQPYWEPRK